jgi:hypothetical protein
VGNGVAAGWVFGMKKKWLKERRCEFEMKGNEVNTFIERTYPSQECSRRWGYTSNCIEAVPAEDSNPDHRHANTPL